MIIQVRDRDDIYEVNPESVTLTGLYDAFDAILIKMGYKEEDISNYYIYKATYCQEN